MPIVKARLKSQLTVVASVIAMSGAALPALAGARAPIIYANESAPAAAAKAGEASSPDSTLDKAAQRIEFRYPGSIAEAGRIEMASAGTTKLGDYGPLGPPPQGAVSRAPVVDAAALQPVVMPKPVPARPMTSAEFTENGIAVVYGDEFAGLPTANGEIFDQTALTAAHPSLPLPSMVVVSNPATGRDVTVRVNDRGPFEDGASFQVSRQVAIALGFEGMGSAELTLRPTGQKAAEVAKPRFESKPAVLNAATQPAPADELLGGDELAGGTGWTTQVAAAKPRAAVQWPDPPADWGVRTEVTKASAVSSGAVYVQLASFSDLGNAETLYRGLRSDLPVEIVPARVNGADYFRVRVGPLASRDAAQDLRDRLNAEGKGDGRVVTAE